MGLGNLKFLKLNFSLTAQDKIFFPKNLKGNIIRGAFGIKFKELNCRPTPICTGKCLNTECLYWKIFEPYITHNIPSGLKDIPRPFIITNTTDEREIIYPGENFNIGFNLFGWACDYYPHFIITVKEMGKEGISSLRGKFLIRNVFSENLNTEKELIFTDDGTLKEIKPFTLNTELPVINNFALLKLKTPTVIKYNSQIIKQPEFFHLFLRIRDRISAIAYFHNGIDLLEDFKLLELEAREVVTIESHWKWIEAKRRSSKTHLLQDLSGITGYGIYDFKTLERAKLFAPWLRIAELVNIGKNSVWGMGEIKTFLNCNIKREKLSEVEYESRR